MRKPRADLEQQLEKYRRELAEAREQLAEALEQQTAISSLLMSGGWINRLQKRRMSCHASSALEDF
jgi:hypothetical protein